MDAGDAGVGFEGEEKFATEDCAGGAGEGYGELHGFQIFPQGLKPQPLPFFTYGLKPVPFNDSINRVNNKKRNGMGS